MQLTTHIEQLVSGPLLKEVIGIRRHLHSHPELSFQETETSAYIRTLLDTWGIPYKFPLVETGFLAWIKGKKKGPVIALRTDMDALPVNEETDRPFRSIRPGIMHACGHDGHTATLFAAALWLKQQEQSVFFENRWMIRHSWIRSTGC